MGAIDARVPSTAALPWHDALWQRVVASRNANRMAHGLLVCGTRGTGRRRFASRLALALLCQAPTASGDGCGRCPGCRQWLAQSHPDVSWLTPEDDSDVIKVDRVRAFTQRLQLTSQYESGRLGWMEPAEQLNRAAANSLLKTLEEPPSGTHLLLVAGQVDRLLPTIRSRCRILRVPPAPVAMGRQWLTQQGLDVTDLDDDVLRMPLAQLEQATDSSEAQTQWRRELAALLAGRVDHVTLAERWNKQPADALLAWLYRSLCDMLATRLGASATSPAAHEKVIADISTVRLQGLCAGVIKASRLRNTNADWQLVLESTLQGE